MYARVDAVLTYYTRTLTGRQLDPMQRKLTKNWGEKSTRFKTRGD